MTLKRVVQLFSRAALHRCPHCGGHPLFHSWFRMRERCPSCGLLLERGEAGYQVGSYMFNIIASELVLLAIFLAVLAPILFYPFTKTLFLAFDLVFRPPAADEFGPG